MRRNLRALNVLAVGLAIVTLLGSVLIPARMTSRISEQLDGIAADPQASAAVDRVRALEWQSLTVNAALVVAALASLVAVVALTRRERRLAQIVRQRLVQESALREAAESLAQALTMDEVTHQITQAAVRAGVAEGAFVEHIVPETTESAPLAVVQAAAGPGMPAPGTSQRYDGSYGQKAIDLDEPILVSDFRVAAGAIVSPAPAWPLSGIVVPLAHTTAPIGALFLVRSRRDRDDARSLAAAYTFGKLAALAYERVRLLEEAREGRDQLQRAMKSRSQLMRGFSHDVKNPLGAANGYADLLALGVHGEISAEQRSTVEDIKRCIQTALGLIDDLHQLGRLETGNVKLVRTPVDLGSLVHLLGEDYKGAARAKGLTLAVDIESDLPRVDTDPKRVREVVDNFLSNAIKYTTRGTITVRVRSESAASSQSVQGVWLDVIDTGPGIPRDKHRLIFEEFTRLGGVEEAGAGLGLAISKLLTDALGGRITLVSGSGTGSTFSLWLPIRSPNYGAAALREFPAYSHS